MFTKDNPSPTAFKKGQSGNPGGRARMPADWHETLKAKTPEAIETLASVMQDKRAAASARVAAAIAILDRAWGKPAQNITADINESPIAHLSFAERRKILMEKMGITPTAATAIGVTTTIAAAINDDEDADGGADEEADAQA